MNIAFLAPAPLLASRACANLGGNQLNTRPPISARKSHAKACPVRMSVSPPAPEILDGPFEGRYGSWYLTQHDADTVKIYRVALCVMAACTTISTGLALTQSQVSAQIYDVLFLVSTGAFGVALKNIHIYMKPLHKTLNFLYAAGLAGALGLLASPVTEHAIVSQTYQHPTLLLAIGWQFVALTGVFIKEAFCFGRLEALALIALTPILTGGHFLGVLGPDLEKAGALTYVLFFLIFCSRKIVQDVVDDLGDMSVFEHLAKGGQL